MIDTLDADYLNSIINYNPMTGICIWKQRPRTDFKYAREHKAWNNKHSETQITSTNPSSGKLVTSLFGKGCTVDNLLWIMTTNEQVSRVNHKNLCNADNRLENLTLGPTGKATKYEGGDICLTYNSQEIYLVASGQPQSFSDQNVVTELMPPADAKPGVHVFNFFLDRKDARVYLMELCEKLQCGWNNLLEEY